MADRSFLEWPFLEISIACWRRSSTPGALQTFRSTITTWTQPAAIWCQGSALMDGCGIRQIWIGRRLMSARFASSARHWHAMTLLQISPSPCKASAWDRSACLAMNTIDSGCRERRKEPPSPALRCRNPPADPTSPIWQRPPHVTVMAGSSMARRPGSPMAA